MCEPPPLAFRLKWGLLALEIEHRTKPPKEQEKVVGTFSLESCDCQIHPLLNQDKLRKRLQSLVARFMSFYYSPANLRRQS